MLKSANKKKKKRTNIKMYYLWHAIFVVEKTKTIKFTIKKRI